MCRSRFSKIYNPHTHTECVLILISFSLLLLLCHFVCSWMAMLHVLPNHVQIYTYIYKWVAYFLVSWCVIAWLESKNSKCLVDNQFFSGFSFFSSPFFCSVLYGLPFSPPLHLQICRRTKHTHTPHSQMQTIHEKKIVGLNFFICRLGIAMPICMKNNNTFFFLFSKRLVAKQRSCKEQAITFVWF